MTPPRRILPGLVWFITRRITRRHFLLRPDADGTTQAIYWYTTAVLAKKFGIVIHAIEVMSTHIHEVLTDTRGNLPNFIRERNRALANALKVHRGWPEEVFQRAPASCVELHGPQAILDKIAYTIANCVEAGLVRSPAEWPGARVLAEDIGTRTVRVDRPMLYFDPNNSVWPARASLRIEMPKELKSAFGDRAGEVVRAFVDSAISAARKIARAAGKVTTSIRGLMRVPFQKRARSFEKFGSRERAFATGGDPSLTMRAKQVRAVFLAAYRAALEMWRATGISPRFPDGTWRWHRELLRAPPSMSVGSAAGSPSGSEVAYSG